MISSLSAPITPPMESTGDRLMTLETHDGIALQGFSFGAEVSAAGELVFQTGMVGYPEAITDPSYEGQILVITYPLVGNYGVPDRQLMDEDIKELPKYFESNRIHIAGLVVAHYTEEYSHYLATSSLGQWLKSENIPAIYGVDTRALTKRLREKGSTLGRLSLQKSGSKLEDALNPETWVSQFDILDWVDPNIDNLVAKVSTKEPVLYKPSEATAIKGSDGKTIRILAIDVGMKYNQIRCFVRRGVELKVVPWDYDFLSEDYDGLFISNGPGDPSVLNETIERVSKALESQKTPVFGICLGHQLMARATGASTLKLKFGNRGHNIPCTSSISGRCYITSQNHGFAVDTTTLKEGWEELFVNANDGSNEGIYHKSKPYFSVQFHPESTPGPRDTEFLFDVFIKSVVEYKETGILKPVEFPGGKLADNLALHPRVNAKKVLVLGSGGLSIGQAGEFDYSGSQAIKALKEEGIYTILINPNIATIQTSKGLADKVYFLPVTAEFVRKVIKHERPDSIYCTFGGQTALGVGIQLKDEFESLGVKVLGTPIETVITTEDRELFASAMEEIGEKCAKSAAASTVQEALDAVKEIGFPVIVRAAYALGGLGSGFADNEKELVDLCNVAFATSPQVLVERSMKGWKEVEYEVVRDAFDNCITVCNMENFDPLGIHTGDSIVVAPSQTLSDEDYNMLRTTAVNVIRHLGVVGECNVQYALQPDGLDYRVIEVNARLSRSSALASKATGYPLLYTAAKIALGHTLPELPNPVTKTTSANFEPSLDYMVTKIPRWDLAKFQHVKRDIGSSMKSVGEVMAIGRNFEESFQKAIRQVDPSFVGFQGGEFEDLDYELSHPTDRRWLAVGQALLHENYTVDQVHDLSKIDKWFLYKLMNIVEMQRELEAIGSLFGLTQDVLSRAKKLGFSDKQIALATGSKELEVRARRKNFGIVPFVKKIDTLAAEFPANTNYLYTTYNASENDVTFDEYGTMVLGSGVYRIGSSVEFDWCAVSTARALRKEGKKTIMVNYNPETVSTDFDEVDRLYFEELSFERVMDIYELENAKGVVVSVGGQLPQNIALGLQQNGAQVLGTNPEDIDKAEDRHKFSSILDSIGVDQPQWKELTSVQAAKEFAEQVGFPVLVRPSYVLSGAAMSVIHDESELASKLGNASKVSSDYPVVISKFIQGADEIDIDAVASNGKVLVHAVSEHVENAGIHSGDATLVLPPQSLSPEIMGRLKTIADKVAAAWKITGPFNMQIIKSEDPETKEIQLKVIECNIRASRSFPFVSKVLGTNFIDVAVQALIGKDVPAPVDLMAKDYKYVATKVPQFSFTRLAGADPFLGVEMASTGEVACFGKDLIEAYWTSMQSTMNFHIPKPPSGILFGGDLTNDKLGVVAKTISNLGYKFYTASKEVEAYLANYVDVPVETIEFPTTDKRLLREVFQKYDIKGVFNLAKARAETLVDQDYVMRRNAIDFGIPLFNEPNTSLLFAQALEAKLPAKLEAAKSDKVIIPDEVQRWSQFIGGKPV